MANIEGASGSEKPKTSAAQKAQKAKKKAQNAKKQLNRLKSIKALAPLVTALGYVAIALVIIFLIIGFIGFFTTLPGLAVDKFLEVCNGFWRYIWGDQSIEVDNKSIDDLANYIEDMGYDLVAYGFASPGTVSKDSETGETTVDWKKENTIQNLYGYVLSNERTYTVQGTERGLLTNILGPIPIVGDLISGIDSGIRSLWAGANPEKYGMIDFNKVSNWDNAHMEVEIDRNNNQMKMTAKSGFLGLWRDVFKYDLSGWTSRYGKPIELSLALHLSTMAPDFVYDFCADKDLQTQVKLNVAKIKYNMNYYYQAKSNGFEIGPKISSDKIIDKFEHINSQQIERINGIFNDDIYLGSASPNDIFPTNLKCYGILYDDCIISVYDEKNDSTKVYYYRAVDKDGKPAFGVDTLNWGEKYYIKFKSDGQPYFEKKSESDTDSKFWNTNSIFSQSGVTIGDKTVCIEMLSLKMLSRFPVSHVGDSVLTTDQLNKGKDAKYLNSWDHFRYWMLSGARSESQYNQSHNDQDRCIPYIEFNRYSNFFKNIDNLIKSSTQVDAEKVKKLELDMKFNEYGKEEVQITDEDGNSEDTVYARIYVEDTKKYGEEIKHNAETMFSEIRSYIWDYRDNDKKSRPWALYESFFGINGEDGFVDLLQKELEQIKFTKNGSLDDINYLKMLVLFADDLQEDLQKWKIDEITFIKLYEIFRDQRKEVTTYEPHIDNVEHHWYKDLNFTDYAYDWVVDTQTSDYKEYSPEGDAADKRIEDLQKNGTFYYTTQTNDKHIVQVKQPKIIKTEPWHYKVKNWVKYGYYFIYDGTFETAKRIETARKVLSKEGLMEAGYSEDEANELAYDLKNPLLISVDDSDQSALFSGTNVDEIEKKAKKLNEILARTDVSLPNTLGYQHPYYTIPQYDTINGKGVFFDKGVGGIRLQRIDFEKKSSLTAFSILEGMHTKDSEYIYRDLKEFLIELGYFTRSDFEEIETDVFKWIIPSYQVYKDEWPDPKFERNNMEYGAYIRSSSSLKEQRDDIEKEQKESGKSVSNSSISGYFTTSGDGYISVTEVNGIYYKNFKQGSGSYASKPYWVKASPGTMAGNGCGPTSAAIMLSGYGMDTSPYDVAQIITNKYEDYTNSTKLVSALKDLNFNATRYDVGGKNDQESIFRIEEALKEGKPVMIAGSFPSQHWICLIGIENGEAIISDPATGIASLNSYVRGNNGYITVKELIEKYSYAASYIIPEKVPNGIIIKQPLQGFKIGLDVIAPEKGKIIEIGEETDDSDPDNNSEEQEKDYFITNGKYLIIEFDSNNGVAGWKMKIEGIDITVNEGDTVKQGDKIGTTTKDNIKIILYDEKDAIINDVEDYFKLKKRKTVSRQTQSFEMTEDEVLMLAKLIDVENGPSYISSLLGGDMETAMTIAKATGYVCINNAKKEGKRIKTGDGGIIYYPKYQDPSAIESKEPSAEALEAAEWCARYDCSSITNPDGVPMTENVTGQAGFEQCPKNIRKDDHSCCWWVVDWKGRGQYGTIEEAGTQGNEYGDLFFSYSN